MDDGFSRQRAAVILARTLLEPGHAAEWRRLEGERSGAPSPPPPKPGEALAALAAERARSVLIGGFALIANGVARPTADVNLIVPADLGNDRRLLAALQRLGAVRFPAGGQLRDEHLLGCAQCRALTAAGLVQVLREGPAPLDFDTVASTALPTELDGVPGRVAGLSALVALKRLAGRPRDRRDLASLAAVHGDLPTW